MHSSPMRPGPGPVLLATVLAIAFAAPPAIRDFADRSAELRLAEAPVAAQSRAPAAPQAVAPAPRAPIAPEEEYRRYAALVEEASRAHGIEPALVHAVILTESSYDPDARSPAGAAGLMQLMPLTAAHYGVKDLYDPRQNIQGGVTFLRDLLRQFDGNVELALAAYNAGTTAVIRAGRRIPPLAETQAYVPKVIDRYRRIRALEG